MDERRLKILDLFLGLISLEFWRSCAGLPKAPVAFRRDGVL